MRHPSDGAVAQLGERVVRNDEVRGSIPLGSTKELKRLKRIEILNHRTFYGRLLHL